MGSSSSSNNNNSSSSSSSSSNYAYEIILDYLSMNIYSLTTIMVNNLIMLYIQTYVWILTSY